MSTCFLLVVLCQAEGGENDLPDMFLSGEPARVLSNFEGANVCAVDIRSTPTGVEIRFAADPRGATEALWFNFRVIAPPKTTLRLILTNPDRLLGGSGNWKDVHPVVREGQTPQGPFGPWRRVEGGSMCELPDGRVEASWTIVADTAVVEVAFCYPYGLAELRQTVEECRGYWKVDQIGVSSFGRPILRLSNSYGDTVRRPAGMYLLARQHAGETPGSWVLDGLLRAACSEIPPDRLVLWIVPLANIDGVIEGQYGKDPHPIDLNRDWGSPIPMRYEGSVLRADIARLAGRAKLLAAIDFHAPGARESVGAYFQVLKPVDDQAEAVRKFVSALVPHLPADLLAQDSFRIASYPSRWNDRGTVGGYMWDRYRVPAPALEVPYSRVRDRVLEVEDYRRLGAAIARALAAYVANLPESGP